MAKRRRSASPIIQKVSESRRGREIPWLTIGAVALIGLPILRDVTADPMRRNRYVDRASCECDYGNRCERDYANGGWTGPWYARDVSDRRVDDPGEGECRRHYGTRYGYSGYGGYGRDTGYRPPTSVESGYRGGFGATGRVRAAGS